MTIQLPARFLTPLRLEDIDGQTMALLEPLKFYSSDLKQIVRVDPPFVTDFASIPRLFQNVVPRNGRYDRPAVIHDAGYRGELRDITGAILSLTKARVDSLFREGMAAEGVGRFTRNAMYLSVRIFGRGSFQKASSGDANRDASVG